MNQEREAATGSETVPEEAAAAPPEDATSETTAAASAAEMERLEGEVARLGEEVLRLRAEMDNVRKRAERDVESAHKYGQERLVQALLPVKDSLDLGLDAAMNTTDVEALREGMALTAKMFGDFFEKLEVRAIDPRGERFDPEFHQAMSTEESVETEPGTVLRVMQKGYALNERLVRPALVVVSRAAGGGDA